MKKVLFFSAAVLLFAAFAFAGNLEISSANYDPTPAMPGSYMTLWVHVKNNSNGDAKNAVFNLKLVADESDSDFPFSLEAGESAKKSLGTIIANQTALVKYKILVDSKALDGVYTTYLETGENSTILKSTPFSIQITKRKPTLMIVSSSPLGAEAGKKAELELLLRNTGNSNALNISVGLAEDRTVTSTGVVVERDIVPLGAAFSNIQSLGIDEQKTVSIPLLINPSASSKAYYVPLRLTFYDDNRNSYTQTEYVGIKVSKEAELGASISEITPALAAGRTSEITVDIFNTGFGTAKYLVFEAYAGEIQLKQREFFIGSLESDDSDSISLEASVPAGMSVEGAEIEIKMTFKDDFGEEKVFTKKLYLSAGGAQDSTGQSQEQSPWFVYAIVLVAIAGIGYWLFSRKKKRK